MPGRADICFSRSLAALLLLGLAVAAAPSLAQDSAKSKPRPGPVATSPDIEHQSAPVEIDGVRLFRVRGIEAFPAEKRAAAIEGRIEALAGEPEFRTDTISTTETTAGSSIVAGDRHIMTVFDADAGLEGLDRRVLAHTYAKRIATAIEEHRAARTRESLVRGGVGVGIATAVLIAALVLGVWLSRRGRAALEALYGRRIQSVGIQSFQIVRAERIRNALHGVLGTLQAVVLLLLAFFYLQYVLASFPWTRGFASRLLDLVLGPLATLGRGLATTIPDLIFLAILFVITRWALKLIRLFFNAVGRGEVALAGFDAAWADATYRLVRVVVIIFFLVVAYPYIPGSESEAFKGLSIFIGVLFSLGASSAVSNMIAGYLITYRRAFKLGDRVKIGDTVGDVMEMRLQVTHLKTVKNEEVIVPNSSILNNEVVNYSSLARKQGLILHTTVGIGYKTPWRQVEAMLLAAAERTRGLLTQPAPFVQQKTLGDFAITYELNAYCDNAQAMNPLYSELHRNILDVFNEFGVQIMTPAYEGDPEAPKVVPKDQWYSAPAKKGSEPDTATV
jgi:small-conductance mechanosensitive channel